MGTPFDFPATPTVGDKWPTTPTAGIPTYVWNGVAWTTIDTPTAPPGGGDFDGLPEAPIDGLQYARKNAAWAEVALTNLLTDAPADGRLFGRKDAAWVQIMSGGGSGGGIGEAPIDGTPYSRKDAAWVAAATGGGGGTGETGPQGPIGPPNTVIYVGSFF